MQGCGADLPTRESDAQNAIQTAKQELLGKIRTRAIDVGADLIALVDKQLYGRRITEMQILLMEKTHW
jgi:hypothetical protein